GIDGVSVASDGTILMAVTAAPECAPVALPPPLSSQVGRVLAAKPGAPPHALTNLATIECTTNPDGTDRNSNPYGIYALGPDHALGSTPAATTCWRTREPSPRSSRSSRRTARTSPCPPPSP